MFFNKVKIAQDYGARGVIIRNYKNVQLVVPKYYGDDINDVTIQSVLMGYYDSKDMYNVPKRLRKKKDNYKYCFWGYNYENNDGQDTQ